MIYYLPLAVIWIAGMPIPEWDDYENMWPWYLIIAGTSAFFVMLAASIVDAAVKGELFDDDEPTE